jgi:pyrroline-5-carboxylate reductase
MTYSLGFLGAGQMAEAIARGILRAGVLKPSQMIASDPSAERRGLFQSQLGIATVEDNKDVARQSNALLLAVKPFHAKDVLAAIAAVTDPQTLLISICAGVSTKAMETALGQDKPWRVVRSMPNTPMLVGEGAVAIAPGAHATQADLDVARKYFECAADVVDLPESQLDAVTALSGSGPAYFFFLVEHLTRAGVEMGLSPEHAHTLATKTAAGSAKMMLTTPDSPTELRRKVTTPNGTTHAAITHMEQHGMPQTIVDALKAAQRRSKELGS